MIQENNPVLHIKGVENTNKLRESLKRMKLLKRMEREGRIKKMSFREMAAVYLSEVDDDETADFYKTGSVRLG